MSKMSDIALQLDEQAVELGFTDHLEALGSGYEWGTKDNGEVFLFNPEKEQEEAHKLWLREKENLIKRLEDLYNKLCFMDIEDKFLQVVDDAIEFVKRGEI